MSIFGSKRILFRNHLNYWFYAYDLQNFLMTFLFFFFSHRKLRRSTKVGGGGAHKLPSASFYKICLSVKLTLHDASVYQTKDSDVLHWLPASQRILYRISALVWRSVTGCAPSYLTDLCRPVSDLASRRALRSS